MREGIDICFVKKGVTLYYADSADTVEFKGLKR